MEEFLVADRDETPTSEFMEEAAKRRSQFLTLKQKIINTDSLIDSFERYKIMTEDLKRELEDTKTQRAESHERHEKLLLEHISLNDRLRENENKLNLIRSEHEALRIKESAEVSHNEQLKEHVKNLEAKVREINIYTADLKNKHKNKIENIRMKYMGPKNSNQKCAADKQSATNALYRYVILYGEKAKLAGKLSHDQLKQLDKFKTDAIEMKIPNVDSDEISDSSTGPPSCSSIDSGLILNDDLKFESNIFEDVSTCSEFSKLSDLDTFSSTDMNNHIKLYSDRATSPVTVEKKSIATSPITWKKLNSSEMTKKETKHFADSFTQVTEEQFHSDIVIVEDDISDSRIDTILKSFRNFSFRPISPIRWDEETKCDLTNTEPKKILKKNASKLRIKRFIKQKLDLKKKKYFSYISSIRNEMRVHKHYLAKRIEVLENQIENIRKVKIVDNEEPDISDKNFDDVQLQQNLNIEEKLSPTCNIEFNESIQNEDNAIVLRNFCDININNRSVEVEEKSTTSHFPPHSNDCVKIDLNHEQNVDNANRRKSVEIKHCKLDPKDLFGEDDNDDTLNSNFNINLKRKSCPPAMIMNPKKYKKDNETVEKTEVKSSNNDKPVENVSTSEKTKKRISLFASKCDKVQNDNTHQKNNLSIVDNGYNTLNATEKIEKAKTIMAKFNDKLKTISKPKIFLNRSTRKLIDNNSNIKASAEETLENCVNENTQILTEHLKVNVESLSAPTAETNSSISQNISRIENKIQKDVEPETCISSKTNIGNSSEPIDKMNIHNENISVTENKREVISYDDVFNTELKDQKHILASIISEYTSLNVPSQRRSPRLEDSDSTVLNIIINYLNVNVTTATLDELIEKLKNYKETVIAHAIMLYLSEKRESNINPILLPGMPMMDYTHQSTLCFLQKVRKDRPLHFKCDIVELVMKEIEFKLFHLNDSPKSNTMQLLSKFYAIFCYATKQKDRLKAFCMDALYCLTFKSIFVVHSVLQVWPQLFPKTSYRLANDPVVIVMMHLMITISDKDKFKNAHLKEFIVKNYGFKGGEYSDDEILKLFTTIIENIEKYSKKSIMAAILLFGKRCGPEWCYKRIIIETLLPILTDESSNCESRAFAAKLIGPLVKPFPPTMRMQREIICGKIITILRNQASPAIHEAVVCSLTYFSKKNYNSIIQEIKKWHPSTPISEETMIILKSLVREKTVMYWINYKNK